MLPGTNPYLGTLATRITTAPYLLYTQIRFKFMRSDDAIRFISY